MQNKIGKIRLVVLSMILMLAVGIGTVSASNVTTGTNSSITWVTCSPSTIIVEANTTCTAYVIGGNPYSVGYSTYPQGAINFSIYTLRSFFGVGVFKNASCTLVPQSTGGQGAISSCNTVLTQSGTPETVVVIANYSGDANFSSSLGYTGLTVKAASPNLKVVCMPSTIFEGQNTTCEAFLTGGYRPWFLPPLGPPTLEISFNSSSQTGLFDNTSNVGRCRLETNSIAAWCNITYTDTSDLLAKITAIYGGNEQNNNFTNSTRVKIEKKIVKPTTTTSTSTYRTTSTIRSRR